MAETVEAPVEQTIAAPAAEQVAAAPVAPPTPTPTQRTKISLDDPMSRAQRVMGVPDNNQQPANPAATPTAVPAQSAQTKEQQQVPPAGTTPASTPAPPADFNPTYFKEKLGIELKDESELKTRLAAFEQFNALQSEKAQLETEKAQLAEQVASSKIEDPYVLKLYELRKNGATPDQIKAFNKASELGDLSTLDNDQKLKLHLQLEKGFDDRTADAHLRRLKAKAVEPVEADFNGDTDSYNEALDDYVIEISEYTDKVKNAESYLKKYVDSSANPLAPNKEAQQAQQVAQAKYQSDVQKVVPGVIEQLASIAVNLNGKTGADADNFNFPIDAEFKKQAPELLTQYLTQNNVPLTQEGIQSGLNYLTAMAKISQYDKDIQKAYNQGASKKEADLRAEYDRNGTFTRSNTLPPDPKNGGEFEAWRTGKLKVSANTF